MDSYREFQTIKYKSFESTLSHWREGQNRFLSKFLNNENRDITILDVGCGDGCGLLWFSNNFYYNAFGCDLSYEKILIANKVSHFPVCVTDAHNLPFINNKFDLICASHVLEHMHNPSNVIQEFHRLLKPEKYLLTVVPFPDTGPDECHCGKYIIKTDPISVSQLGCKGIIDFFSRKFTVAQVISDTFREPEIWLQLRKIC